MLYKKKETRLAVREFHNVKRKCEEYSNSAKLIQVAEIDELKYFDVDLRQLLKVVEIFKLELNK